MVIWFVLFDWFIGPILTYIYILIFQLSDYEMSNLLQRANLNVLKAKVFQSGPWDLVTFGNLRHSDCTTLVHILILDISVTFFHPAYVSEWGSLWFGLLIGRSDYSGCQWSLTTTIIKLTNNNKAKHQSQTISSLWVKIKD